MPPKADPYATPLLRRIDVLLVVLTIALAGIFFFISEHGRIDHGAKELLQSQMQVSNRR